MLSALFFLISALFHDMLSALFGVSIRCVVRLQNVVIICCVMLLKMCQNMKMGLILKMARILKMD
jgi:hypothetical protein